jgi:hypothetical protein
MAYEVSEGLRRIARELRDSAGSHRAEDARAELARLWSQIEHIVERRLRPAARDAARDMRDYSRDARHYLDDGREVALDAAWRVREAARAHPLMAVGIAVATTWVVASLMRGRR